MSANIAVIYCSAEVRDVAEAFGEAAEHLSARVRLLRVPGAETDAGSAEHPEATLEDLEWSDGIAFGTSVRTGRPSPELMASRS